MLQALNIPALVSPPCPIPLAPCSLSIALCAFSGKVCIPIPFALALPFPFLFPFPFAFPDPFPFPFSCPFPSSVALPFSFSSSIAFRFPFSSFAPVCFLVPYSPPCMSSSHSLSSVSLPLPAWLLPPLGARGSAQFSSSSLWNISSQYSGLLARKSPGL